MPEIKLEALSKLKFPVLKPDINLSTVIAQKGKDNIQYTNQFEGFYSNVNPRTLWNVWAHKDVSWGNKVTIQFIRQMY